MLESSDILNRRTLYSFSVPSSAVIVTGIIVSLLFTIVANVNSFIPLFSPEVIDAYSFSLVTLIVAADASFAINLV